MKTKSIYNCLHEDSKEVRDGVGLNRIPPPEKEPLWKQYLEKFKDPIIIVLLVVFAFSVIVSIYEYSCMGKDFSIFLEPIGVLLALLLATGVAFVFEVKAGKEFDILNKVKDSRPVKVYRYVNGKHHPRMMLIKKHDVVVGDVVKLESGDEVPADGELIESNMLRVDESNFTGELYATKTTIHEKFDPDATYPSNFLLRGSTVIEGTAVFKVTHIGMDTEEGKGVAKVNEGSDVETPLNRQLAQLSKYISIVSFVFAVLIVVGRLMYYLLSGNADESFINLIEFILASIMIAVTLIVVAVPEGLPMSVTVSLALSMRRMLRENNLVRKLHACETMGAATVICTDKTGTLTKNKMTVVETCFFGGDKELELIRANMAVNSTAEVSKNEKGELVTIGNPTEVALLKWMHKNGPEYEHYRDNAVYMHQEPFSTESKRMTTTVVLQDAEYPIRFVKGAPEVVLAMCDRIAGDGTKEQVQTALAGYQKRAMRTLGFAYQPLNDDAKNEKQETIFLGVVGIADPVREDVPDAIKMCKDNAHVRVIIVTGDTPGTANEIARQIGLLDNDEEPLKITGPEFEAMENAQALELVMNPKFKVLSRARPNDKARLVTLLQQCGQVVAVTGDGTNDAPALSKAQVGLSMGDGTSRAKEASDITIIDNSFASINKAIMWGRSLYQNIRRFIIFQMTINVCACLIVLFGAFLGTDSPLTVTQMLWVNLIMDTFAAMALSSLPADKSVLYQRPRDPNSHILNRPMLLRIIGVGMLFFVMLIGMWQLLWHKDITQVADLVNLESLKLFVTGFFSMSRIKEHLNGYELAVFFSTFVMLQFWNLFNAKYFNTRRSLIQDIVDLFGNREKVKESFSSGFLLIAAVIVLGQVLIVTFAGQLFSVERLSLADWGLIMLLTSPVLIVADVARFVRNKIRK